MHGAVGMLQKGVRKARGDFKDVWSYPIGRWGEDDVPVKETP